MTVHEIPALGLRVEVRHSDAELFEFDVVGRARGFITQAHVHERQTERHEVIEGAMRLVLDGREHVLQAGEAMEVPPGSSHRQLPAGDGESRVRVQMRPGGNTEAFMARLDEMSAHGQLNRWGYPRPLAGAALVRERSTTRSPTRARTRSGGGRSTSTWRRTAHRRSARSRTTASRAACRTS